ncbi:MAG TPA: DUF3300 domain-containing protein [Polyangiaceae bacterium]|nr:DUF3300 domain-containing protein [Polyangiaceae bacterium]
MAQFTTRFRLKGGAWRGSLAVAWVWLIGPAPVFAQVPSPAAPAPAPAPAAPATGAPAPGAPAPAASAPAAAAVKLSPEQLDSLVAPIALYPDPLLAQALAASTYPLEIIQLQQWQAKNPNLKDKELADAVAQQPWDPAIQSLAAIPELTKRLADDIQWTTDLGNAFLAQQSEVMDAVQRMRKKAQAKGALASNEQQKVETKIVETKEVIVVVPAKPEVVYVPVYSPTVVYGPPVYPYPPVYYPPYTPGAAFVTFGVGVLVGAAIWGGTCCGCGWGHGHGNVTINNFNNFNRNTNINRNINGNGNWQHNAEHRGGTPYSDRATATKYGGSARGDSAANRQQRAAGPSVGNQMNRATSPRPMNNSASGPGVSDRSAGAGRDGGNRAPSAGSSNRSGGDRIGSREIGGSSSSRGGGGFGSSSSFSGDSARANSSRGAASAGGRGGGGRAGGGRGGRR